jgi:hypothetical protein
MDVLGILLGIFEDRWTFHWRLGQLWDEECHGCTFSRKCCHSRDCVLPVPDAVLCLHCPDRYRWCLRERKNCAILDLWVLLGYCRLLSHRMLDVERKWMVIQRKYSAIFAMTLCSQRPASIPRLRRWWTRPYRIRLVSSGICLRPREAQARWRQVPRQTSQHHSRLLGNRIDLVRLVRFQRRQRTERLSPRQ